MTIKRIDPQAHATKHPSTEAQPMKGTWTAAQKLAILAEYESYPRGDPRRGALLRRVGAYTSHISKWRDQQRRGTLTSQTQPTAGRPAQSYDPQHEELARLQRENARLQAELHKATTIIDVQKKVATLLGMPFPPPPRDDAS